MLMSPGTGFALKFERRMTTFVKFYSSLDPEQVKTLMNKHFEYLHFLERREK